MSADLKMLESIQNTQSISREELDAILQTQGGELMDERNNSYVRQKSKQRKESLCFSFALL